MAAFRLARNRPRRILHLDRDALLAAVELLRPPALRGRTVGIEPHSADFATRIREKTIAAPPGREGAVRST